MSPASAGTRFDPDLVSCGRYGEEAGDACRSEPKEESDPIRWVADSPVRCPFRRDGGQRGEVFHDVAILPVGVNPGREPVLELVAGQREAIGR